jgi:E3 ubiquitin-protein ligase RNF38/44
VDHIVVESLSVFQFSALHGQKEGLVCAMCLGWFNGIDTTTPMKQ